MVRAKNSLSVIDLLCAAKRLFGGFYYGKILARASAEESGN
jgi:hypothetical protein